MKVGQGRNFSDILTNFKFLGIKVIIIMITIWCNKSMENVVANILVYYKSVYINYYLRK